MFKFFLPVRFRVQVKNNGTWTTCYDLRTEKEILKAMETCNWFLGVYRIIDKENNVVFPEF